MWLPALIMPLCGENWPDSLDEEPLFAMAQSRDMELELRDRRGDILGLGRLQWLSFISLLIRDWYARRKASCSSALYPVGAPMRPSRAAYRGMYIGLSVDCVCSVVCGALDLLLPVSAFFREKKPIV